MTQEESKQLLNNYLVDNPELAGNYEYIGSGLNGHAYKLQNGLALKITTDIIEVNTAENLKSLNLDFIVQYHTIDSIEGIGYVLMDYITPLNAIDDILLISQWDNVKTAMNELLDVYNLDVNELHWGNCGYYNDRLIFFDMKFKN